MQQCLVFFLYCLGIFLKLLSIFIFIVFTFYKSSRKQEFFFVIYILYICIENNLFVYFFLEVGLEKEKLKSFYFSFCCTLC